MRDWTLPDSVNASSTISSGTNWVRSPRCPGANRHSATVTVRVMTD